MYFLDPKGKNYTHESFNRFAVSPSTALLSKTFFVSFEHRLEHRDHYSGFTRLKNSDPPVFKIINDEYCITQISGTAAAGLC